MRQQLHNDINMRSYRLKLCLNLFCLFGINLLISQQMLSYCLFINCKLCNKNCKISIRIRMFYMVKESSFKLSRFKINLYLKFKFYNKPFDKFTPRLKILMKSEKKILEKIRKSIFPKSIPFDNEMIPGSWNI